MYSEQGDFKEKSHSPAGTRISAVQSGVSRISTSLPKNERQLRKKISFYMSRGSSSSKVSDYGLDDRAIEVRSPTGEEDFSSSPCVQTGSGAHPASYPMGTGGSFPGGKARPGSDADHSPPSSAEVKN
jgi:hypothetical protein